MKRLIDTSRIVCHLAGAVTAAWIVAPHVGDLEVYCVGGIEITERWPATVSTIPWDITFTTQSGLQYWTGGAPALNGFSAPFPLADKPGVSSLVDAARNWDVPVLDIVDSSGQPASSAGGAAATIAFSAQPNLVERTTANFAPIQVANFTYVPPTVVQCCYGWYRAFNTFTIPDTILFESIGGTARNTVDFIGNGRYWQSVLLQPTTALAVSAVRVVGGQIQEFDIGFNACRDFWQNQQTSGPCTGLVCATHVPGLQFSWLNQSRALDIVIGNPGGNMVWQPSAGAPQVSVDWPQIAFADVEGVATHEFGHALGLGHTYLAGRSNLDDPDRSKDDPTDFPTLFPYAQSSRLEESYAYIDALQAPGQVTFGDWTMATPGQPSTWPAPANAFQDNPLVRGLLGYSARSLELDDVAAFARGYPSDAFLAQTTTIAGTVSRNGAPYVGAMVTAFEVRNPNTVCASTLTYTGGTFTISGLPRGQYVVRVEPFPRGILNDAAVLPTYLSACPVDTADFPAEYFNVGEAASELSSVASVIPLQSAGASATVTFVLDGAPFGQWASPVMTIAGASASGASGVAPYSTAQPNRSMLPIGGAYDAFDSGATAMNVQLRIDGSQAYASGVVAIGGSVHATMGFRLGNLLTVQPDWTLPTTVVGALDASGVWQGTVPVHPKVGKYRSNVLLEAYVLSSSAPTVVTNSVGAWFSY